MIIEFSPTNETSVNKIVQLMTKNLTAKSSTLNKIDSSVDETIDFYNQKLKDGKEIGYDKAREIYVKAIKKGFKEISEFDGNTLFEQIKTTFTNKNEIIKEEFKGQNKKNKLKELKAKFIKIVKNEDFTEQIESNHEDFLVQTSYKKVSYANLQKRLENIMDKYENFIDNYPYAIISDSPSEGFHKTKTLIYDKPEDQEYNETRQTIESGLAYLEEMLDKTKEAKSKIAEKIMEKIEKKSKKYKKPKKKKKTPKKEEEEEIPEESEEEEGGSELTMEIPEDIEFAEEGEFSVEEGKIEPKKKA
jgi:hypothetical protein